jgi:hypothetical protein
VPDASAPASNHNSLSLSLEFKLLELMSYSKGRCKYLKPVNHQRFQNWLVQGCGVESRPIN